MVDEELTADIEFEEPGVTIDPRLWRFPVPEKDGPTADVGG